MGVMHIKWVMSVGNININTRDQNLTRIWPGFMLTWGAKTYSQGPMYISFWHPVTEIKQGQPQRVNPSQPQRVNPSDIKRSNPGAWLLLAEGDSVYQINLNGCEM